MGSTLNNAAAEAQNFIAQKQAEDRLLMYHCIEDHALGPNGNNLFLEYEGRSWTYKQFHGDLQRVGNYLLNDLGIKKGELVALNGPNSPEYLMIWFALDGIGACIAFTNCHLTGNPLVHSVKVRGKAVGIGCTQLTDSACRSSLHASRTRGH